MKTRLVLLLSSGMAAAVLGCCASVTLAQDAVHADVVRGDNASPVLHGRDSAYRLQDGDVVEIDFALSPEFNQTLTVQPDGVLSLKDAGTVRAEGLSVSELAASLQSAYSGILRDPRITVSLKEFVKPYFIVMGQVAKPGKYDLRGPLTITQGVAMAGGFGEKAKNSRVVLFRPTAAGGFDAKVIDVKKLLAERHFSEDLRLMPGDTLYVPQSAFSHIRPFLPTTAIGAYYNPLYY